MRLPNNTKERGFLFFCIIVCHLFIWSINGFTKLILGRSLGYNIIKTSALSNKQDKTKFNEWTIDDIILLKKTTCYRKHKFQLNYSLSVILNINLKKHHANKKFNQS